MHDPMTVAWEIKSPVKRKSEFWPKGYRDTLITIWHVDPETDHTDDSCGWFMRSRHGDKAVLERIVKAYDFDWDRVFKSDSGKVFYTGYFYPEDAGAGMPNMGVTAIILNMFFIAANEVFKVDGCTNWKKTRRWMQDHLFDIMLFAENPTDSLRHDVVRFWGQETKRDERIRNIASCIYGWILRETRPWYKHPRYHVHHWKVQWHFGQKLWRWLFERCSICGKGFKFKECPITDWNHTRIWHHSCDTQLHPKHD